MWQIWHNSLGVRAIRAKRNIIAFKHCAFCNTYEASLYHLFGGCPHLILLWQLQDLKDRVSHTLHWSTLLNTLSNVRHDRPSIIKFLFLMWSIWNEKNSIIFHNDSLNVYEILHKAKFYFHNRVWGLQLTSAYPLVSVFPFLSPSFHSNVSFLHPRWLGATSHLFLFGS